MAAGRQGRRLPACYEVVDAELHAILLALRTVAGRPDAGARRCLIMSDSLTGLEMVERAWRRGVTWQGPQSGRAALLQAINHARERLELVVMMWTPAHCGVAPNAYADAAAKAYLAAAAEAQTERMVLEQMTRVLRNQVCTAAGGRSIYGGSCADTT
mgnify:CR=1 FL=1